MNKTNHNTRINNKLVHELLSSVIKSAGFYVEVKHKTTPHFVELESGKTVKANATTVVDIYEHNPRDVRDVEPVAQGVSICLAGDGFNRRIGIHNAMNRAYRNLRSSALITRTTALEKWAKV